MVTISKWTQDMFVWNLEFQKKLKPKLLFVFISREDCIYYFFFFTNMLMRKMMRKRNPQGQGVFILAGFRKQYLLATGGVVIILPSYLTVSLHVDLTSNF